MKLLNLIFLTLLLVSCSQRNDSELILDDKILAELDDLLKKEFIGPLEYEKYSKCIHTIISYDRITEGGKIPHDEDIKLTIR